MAQRALCSLSLTLLAMCGKEESSAPEPETIPAFGLDQFSADVRERVTNLLAATQANTNPSGPLSRKPVRPQERRSNLAYIGSTITEYIQPSRVVYCKTPGQNRLSIRVKAVKTR